MTDRSMTCFAVSGDSLVGGLDVAPAIAAFFLVCASPVIGLIAGLSTRLIARRHVRRADIAVGAGLTAALVVLGLAVGCWSEIGPLPDIARWVVR